MTTERLHQIETAFSQIVELPPEQRGAALNAACGDDAALRAELESLLRHAEPPGEFLGTPALNIQLAAGVDGARDEDLSGQAIGPYRVLQRHGAGGMGAVYLAQRVDGQFDQQVAIKVVKRGMDSEEILRRFTQERRTLAALVHPNIARLLDAGALRDGRPYLVMEFVHGVPIDQHCDERRLNVTQRLQLFSTVCDAVRFAHQNLVIHRDLKPGNILVDESGIPKLLDFGIAKVIVGTGSAEVTIAEERRFTPEYASPEQVAGRLPGTASDVYSLGVILFELLTGRRPYRFDTRTATSVEHILHRAIPDPPSTVVGRDFDAHPPARTASATLSVDALSRCREESTDRLRKRLRGDLDTIVLKALHKDPAQRYASVEQFVDDIRRHLDGLPVLARPDSPGYRLGKFVRRHAVGVVATVVGIAVLAAGAGVATWQAAVARRERDAAYLARDQAEATVDFFQRMLAGADPQNEGPDAKVRAVLDAAALQVESELSKRPLLQASILSTVGRTYLSLGLMDSAEKHIVAAYETRRRRLPPGHHDIAESEFDMAQLLYAQAKYADAERLLTQSLETHRHLRGDENIDTARVWNDLGSVRRAAGNLSGAAEAHRHALEIRERIAGRESLDVAESLNNMAGVARDLGDLDGCAKQLEEALAIRRRLLRDEHPLVLQSMANVAVMSSMRGDHARAEELYPQVIALGRRVFGPDHPTLAVDLSGYGRVLMRQSRHAEAEPLLRESLDIRRRHLKPDDERLLKTQASLGQCLLAMGRDNDAEPLLADAIAKARPTMRKGDSQWLEALAHLEALYTRIGDAPKAKGISEVRTELSRNN